MTFEVRAATDADRPHVAQLIAEMIPGVDAGARLRWLYDANPGGAALTWIALERGEVAGCTSYFPFRIVLDGHEQLAALGGDGYVRPKFRRRGLGALLHDVARHAMPEHSIGCMYGAPGAMNLTPLKHGGSREIGHVARWARPLRAKQLDRFSRAVLRPRFTARLEPMTRFDLRVEDVWNAFAPTIRLGAVRDIAFYDWRFLDAPAQKQQPYVIVDRGNPIGACALQMIDDHLRVVDVMAIPGEWHRCLKAIVRHAAETNAKFVDIKLMALDGRRRAMWLAGFVERDTKPFLVVVPNGGDRRMLDPMRWFYCGGDSDLDFFD